ncbi:MAG: antitoxin VapB family protein [Candidatus Helarchaeota archaeon]
MAKTIAVSDEVYELLSKLKLPKESFSDVIKRIIKRGGKLMDIAGKKTITKEEWIMIQEKYHTLKEKEVKRKTELIRKMRN